MPDRGECSSSVPLGRRGLTIRNLAAGLVIRGGALVLGAVTAVVVARVMPANSVAQVLVALSVGTMVGVIGQAGLPLSIAHRVARVRVGDAGIESLRQDLRGAATYLVVAATAISLLALPPWPLDPSRLIPGGSELVFLGAVTIGVGRAASRVLSEPTRGYGSVITAGFGAEVLGPAAGLLGLGLLALAGPGGVSSSEAVWIVGGGWCAAAVFALWRVPVRPALRRKPRDAMGESFMSVAGILAVVSILNVGIQHVHIIIGGAILPATAAAVFAVAARLAPIAGTPLVLLTAISSPDVGVAVQSGDEDTIRQLERRLQSVTGILLIGGAGLSATFMIAGEWILTTLFGEAYGAGHLVLAVLSLGPLGSLAAGVAGLCLTQAGERVQVLKDTVIGSVVALAGMLVGGEVAGGPGLATGYVVGLITMNALLLRSCSRLLGLMPFANPVLGVRASVGMVRGSLGR